jgi:hypothetical protein
VVGRFSDPAQVYAAPVLRRAALAGLLVLAGACGSGASPTRVASEPTTTSSSTTTTLATTTTTAGSVHFDTPEEAMTYLAEAWNADDQVSLRHVTNPAARGELDAMHSEATNLQLDRCELNEGVGDYTCTFTHDYPATHPSAGEHGEAVFLAGPADKPGWYMTVFESCG